MSTNKLTKREFSFDAVVARIQVVLESKKQKDVADALGISTGDWGNRKKRQAIPYDKIVSWASKRNVNIDWLLTGNGSMQPNNNEQELNDDKSQMVLALFNALSEDDQREILHAAEKKKRFNDKMTELEALLAAHKKTG